MNELNQQVPAKNGADFFKPMDEAKVEAEAADWYEKWRARIRAWVAKNTGDSLADVLLLVPDLFIMLVRTATDKRVPLRAKATILLALAYVLTPVDFMPEALLGAIGLADDAGVMAALVVMLSNLRGVDPNIMREHWRGQGDVLQVGQQLYDAFEKNASFLSPTIWNMIKGRFSQDASVISGNPAKKKRKAGWLSWLLGWFLRK